MMPSVHIAVTSVVACRWMKGCNIFLFSVFAFFLHFVFDLIPHADPGTLGYSVFTDPGVWTFWWAAIDFLGGLIFVWLVVQAYPEYGRLILLGAFFSILPDLLQTIATVFPDGSEWQYLITNFHRYIHDVWRENMPKSVSVPLGITNTVVMWWASYQLLPKSRSIWWLFEY